MNYNMENTQAQLDLAPNERSYDWEKEVKAFDETKAGVKGLVDAGILKIPRFFVLPENKVSSPASRLTPAEDLKIPVIDIKDLQDDNGGRKRIVDQIRSASETWGFFQVVNHSTPKELMEEMIDGVRRFHEQTKEEKMEFYSRDNNRKVKYNSNFQLHNYKTANWRDTLYFSIAPVAPDPEEYPAVCRDVAIKYSAHIKDLGLTILELLSEALGLKPNHLIDVECAKHINILSHYSPPCPEPTRTLGSVPHKDPSFITILMQDQIGGLQVFHRNQWADIPPIPGAFVVNIGDLLQLISNDKFKSCLHKVLAHDIGPRISVGAFFSTQFQVAERTYGPMKELLSDENPPVYREILPTDYASHFTSRGLDVAAAALDHFRL